MTVQQDPVVSSYMRRLEEATDTLPTDHRVELLADVREHIGVHIGDPSTKGDAGKLQLLDQLGTPEEIARAAHDEEECGGPREGGSGFDTPTVPPQQEGEKARPGSLREGNGIAWVTIALLSLGGFLLLVGWVIGLVMLWNSPRWGRLERLAGSVLVPGGCFFRCPSWGRIRTIRMP